MLDQALHRLRKTKRPEREELAELLAEVRCLGEVFSTWAVCFDLRDGMEGWAELAELLAEVGVVQMSFRTSQ